MLEKREHKTPGKCKPETVAKYSEALKLYAETGLSNAEICRRCGVSVNGFSRYINTYHRHLMLRRNGVKCNPESAGTITIGQLRGQRPETHAKYKDAIEACDSMEYIGCNVSEIAREFGLNGTDLGKQLRMHYPEVLEFRERARQRLGLGDGLQRGSRRQSREQYADAVELLKAEPYITVRKAAEICGVSYSGLEQHLMFYHKDLVSRRIDIREEATGRKMEGEINGKGSMRAPSPEAAGKYAEAVRLYATTSLPAMRIARMTGLSRKRFYAYLRRWHTDLICRRKNIPYEPGNAIDLSKTPKGNPSTREKYAKAITRLKEGGSTMAEVAMEFGFSPDALRGYLKAHEPELWKSVGRIRTENGKTMGRQSMEKYGEAVRLYSTTTEEILPLARRFGVNDCALRDFIKRHFPEAIAQHKKLVKEASDN